MCDSFRQVRHPVAAIWWTVLFAFGSAYAQSFPGLEHFPITSALENQPIEINVRMQSSNNPPVYVRVYFKSVYDNAYRHLDLRGNFDTYSGAIPARYVKAPAIHYFVLAFFRNQMVASVPAFNPYGRPFEVTVREAQSSVGEQQEVQPKPASDLENRLKALERASQAHSAAIDTGMSTSSPELVDISEAKPSIEILSPAPFEEIAPADLLIAVSFLGGENGIDSSSVHIKLDGRDVTAVADVTPFMLTFTPEDLPAGEHAVVVWGNSWQGEQLPAASWKFVISASAEERFAEDTRTFFARAYGEVREEKFSGQVLSTKNIGGDLNGVFGPFSFQGQVLVTSLESSRFQPRNRFMFMAESRMIDFGLGDLYPYFNELTLWGRRVRGFSGALKLGLINFQFVTGQTNRLVKPIYAAPDSILESGTYRQNLMAGRVSFGGGKRFQLGVSLVKVKDDVNSLKSKTESSIAPKDNLIPGVDFLLALDSRRIELRASAAFSLLTSDISEGPATKAVIDSTFNVDIPFDPADYEKYLVLNESTIPLDPLGLTSLAYQASLNLNYFGHYFQFGFKRFGPEYNSLGQTYLRNNLMGFFVNDRFGLFENKLFTTIGFENYVDNFGQEDENPAVDLRTINFSLSYYPSPYLPSLNISVRNYLRDNGVNNIFTQPSGLGTLDTTDTREQNLTRDINFSVSYDFNVLNLKHNASISIINSKLIDQYSDTRPKNFSAQDLSTTVQMVSLKSELQQPMTTLFTYATNRNESAGGLGKVNFDLWSGRADYRLMNDQLNLYGLMQFISSSGIQKNLSDTTLAVINYQQNSFRIGLSFTFSGKHTLMLDAEFIDFNDKGQVRTFGASGTLEPNPSYKNHVFRVYYEFKR